MVMSALDIQPDEAGAQRSMGHCSHCGLEQLCLVLYTSNQKEKECLDCLYFTNFEPSSILYIEVARGMAPTSLML